MFYCSPLTTTKCFQEVGEALAPVYRKILLPSYGIAIAYVLGDTYHKSLDAYMAELTRTNSINNSNINKSILTKNKNNDKNIDNTNCESEILSSLPSPAINYSDIAIESGDTFLWQMLASVTIPGML